ncbi:hypothetical protein HZB06_03345 [Candidatus Wolfebacteria bacterium]|nr:hypothetical protein [Candidatus Wolfebacteria bacterium]
MATITIPKKELKGVIKESVREVFIQELMKLRVLALPLISLKEQKEIEKLYGKPSRKTTKIIEIEL